MGCSASRAHTFITKDHQYSSNISPSSHSQYAYSDASSTPVSRTLSLPTPLVHHPPICKGDTNHLVSLTSTTYGSLVLIDAVPNPNDPDFKGQDLLNSTIEKSELKNVSDPGDPVSPDSVINTWELMEGLDEVDFDGESAPLESPKGVEKSRSFDSGYHRKETEVNDLVKTYEIVEIKDTKPLWQHLSEESLLANMDPNVGSSYRRALWSKRFEGSEAKDIVKKGIEYDELDTKRKKATEYEDLDVKRKKENENADLVSEGSKMWNSEFYLCGGEDRIVLYYTSLRGIRKTYENCCQVRMIFRGFRVFVDEKDISMDSSYRKELQDVLMGKAVSLPQVFIRGHYIGGADEIKQLHEAGDLAKLLKGFPIIDLAYVCDSCGDARFVLCTNCNGSRKVFEEDKGKFRMCPQCNENGLVRCLSCCP